LEASAEAQFFYANVGTSFTEPTIRKKNTSLSQHHRSNNYEGAMKEPQQEVKEVLDSNLEYQIF
jgi:hypothetical protein